MDPFKRAFGLTWSQILGLRISSSLLSRRWDCYYSHAPFFSLHSVLALGYPN